MKNNYAFIDGQNLHFGIKSLGWKLDHKKFRTYLEKEHDVTRAYIFLGFMEEHQDLYNVLQEAGFICYFKPMVRYDDGTIKGNVDADMVLQVMVDIENYDDAVIISGDGDFSGMLRHLIWRKKLGMVVIPNRNKYSSLFDRLDGFDDKHVTFMNDLRSVLSYHPGKNPSPKKSSKTAPIGQQPSTHDMGPQFPKDDAKSKSRVAEKKDKSEAKTRPKNPRTRQPANRDSEQNPKPTAARPKRKPTSRGGYTPKAVVEQSLIDTINGN